MNKREENRRQAERDFEECRQAIAKLSDTELAETLHDVPHRKWLEIEKDTHMAIGIITHRAADRIAELDQELSQAASAIEAKGMDIVGLTARVAKLESALQAAIALMEK